MEKKVDLPSEDNLIRQIRLTSEIVWKKQLSKTDIDLWLSNFKGEVHEVEYERKIALWLLANFVFYNDDEVKHLCKTLYHDFIHSTINLNDNSIEDAYKVIFQRSRFFSLGVSGESSGYILYYFRKENSLPIKNFISNPENLSPNVDTIVFVDDVALSGEGKSQAADYITELKEKYPSLENKKIVLLTFIATQEAKKFLEEEGYNVINCITLNERNRAFHENSLVFAHFGEHLVNAKKMTEHYGKKIKPNNPLGYNDCQFMFGFFYNTPDNTLPIFWGTENNWKPILKRYQKNYKNKLADLGKFV